MLARIGKQDDEAEDATVPERSEIGGGGSGGVAVEGGCIAVLQADDDREFAGLSATASGPSCSGPHPCPGGGRGGVGGHRR
jgi:hypothetical protein